MTGEQYAHGGASTAPHGPPAATAAEQRYQGAVGAPPTAARPPMPPQTTGVSASASAALGYGALLKSHRPHPHTTIQQGHYIPATSGPVPPPLPQHYAVGAGNSPRRRLSNAPSDPSDKVHARPIRAGPANSRSTSSSEDGFASSEDEIEALKRAMDSDQQTAQQRLRVRRERLRYVQGSGEAPSSPATQGTAQSATGMASGGPAYSPGYPNTADISPSTQHTYTFPHPQQQPQQQPPPPQRAPHPQVTMAAYEAHMPPSADSTPLGTATVGMYTYPTATLVPQQPGTQGGYGQTHYSHYPAPHQYPQQQQQQQQQPAASAYPATSAHPFAHAAATTSSAAAHVLPAVTNVTTATRDYVVQGHLVEPGPQHRPSGGYPSVDGSARHESASARSNDQLSGTVTEASGYSQAYWQQGPVPYPPAQPQAPGHLQRQQRQSPTQAPAQSPLHPAASSPMEQKASAGHGRPPPPPPPLPPARPAAGVGASGVGTPAGAAGAPIHDVHVTDTGSTGAYHASDAGEAVEGGASAAGPQPQPGRLPFSYSAAALTQMQERKKGQHPQSPTEAAPANGPPPGNDDSRRSPLRDAPADPAPGAPTEASARSGIAIQSLLNSPEDEQAKATRFVKEKPPAYDDVEGTAIHRYIAKENARFRRQSGPSGLPPQLHQQSPQPALGSMANNNSSPNSQSSYHSAGYSMWQGRADTIMDYATAQQSFSSADDMPESSQHRSPPYYTDAPVPAIPATFASGAWAPPATAAAQAMLAFESIVLPPKSPNVATQPPMPPIPTSASVDRRYGRAVTAKDDQVKPVSILVQVGDGSREDISDDRDNMSGLDSVPSQPGDDESRGASQAAASDAGESNVSPVGRPERAGPGDPAAENPFSSTKPARKATNESLDNVLEYYQMHSGSADDEQSDAVNPFDFTQHLHQRTDRVGSSLFSSRKMQPSPLYQRTSVSSPIDKPGSTRKAPDVTEWKAQVDKETAEAHPGVSALSVPQDAHPGESPIALDFAELVASTQPATPMDHADSSALDAEASLSARPAVTCGWQQQGRMQPQGPHNYRDVYSMLEQLPEPDDLQLPPTSTTLDHMPSTANSQMSSQSSPPHRRYPGGSDISDDNDGDSILQMESIEGFDQLSDIIDMSTAQDSDYGYSNSGNSTDSFGEPIEHEVGMLSKSLLDSIPRNDNGFSRDEEDSITQLAEGFTHTGLTPVATVNYSQQQQHQSSRAESQRPPETASGGGRTELYPVDRRVSRYPVEIPHSGRTNASTLTTSTDRDELRAAAVAAVGSSGDGAYADKRCALPGTDDASSALPPATAAAGVSGPSNCLPLDIMELGGELEIAIARQLEDYYSQHEPTVIPLQLSLVESLGKAVRQQVWLQKQQVHRRKSNIQLSLASSAHDGVAEAAPAEAAPDPSAEHPFESTLEEISQYFTQSGLSLVFPLTSRWCQWVLQHPNKPLLWHHYQDDMGADWNPDDDSEDGELDDGMSSFGGAPQMMSHPLAPDHLLSMTMIPMTMRRPSRVADFSRQEKCKGINAHWQYYSVINQIISVATSIHRKLELPEAQADHTFVAHELAALYQFLGGDFKKYKDHIQKEFDGIKQGLGVNTPPPSDAVADGGGSGEESDSQGDGLYGDSASNATQRPRILPAKQVETLRRMMADIIIDALYSMNRVVALKEHPPPNTPTQQRGREQQNPLARDPPSYAISTLKGLPTQPIIRYLAKEMRVGNGDRQRRNRGLGHTLSRNSSVGHLRHHQYMYQPAAPPVPPLPQPQPADVGDDTAAHGSAKHTNDPIAADSGVVPAGVDA